MRYDIILFDADGTLLDFIRAEDEALRESLLSMGISADDEMVRTYSSINDSLWKALERGEVTKDVLRYRRFERFFSHYGFELDAHVMASKYEDALSQNGYLLDGADALCERLYGKAKMYIVTNGIEAIQRGRYAICGLEKYFDDIFISGCVGHEKPDVRYFEHVERSIPDFCKERAVILGDSLTSDMMGGIAYGIDTCWYNPKGKSLPENMTLTRVSDTFDDIYGFLTDGE